MGRKGGIHTARILGLPSPWPLGLWLLAAMSCGGSGNNPEEVPLTPPARGSEPESGQEVLEAWQPTDAVFCLESSETGDQGVTREICAFAESGDARRVTRSGGDIQSASTLDSHLDLVTLDAGAGDPSVTSLAPRNVVPPLGASLGFFLPPAAALGDPRATWTVAPGTSSDELVLSTTGGGPFDAVLVIAKDSWLPKEYTVTVSGTTRRMEFSNVRFLQPTDKVKASLRRDALEELVD